MTIFLWICLALVCFSHDAAGQNSSLSGDNFCFFTTGQYIFTERMKKQVPSAKLQGVAELQNIYGHLPYTDVYDLQCLYGAVYYVPNSDQPKVVELARKEMFIAKVTVALVKKGRPSESIECVTMNVAPSPYAYPFAIYAPFPRGISKQAYLYRLRKIGAPRSYISWLKQFRPSNDNAYPPPAYIQPRGFVPPQPKPPGPSFGPGPAIQDYKIPPNQMCVFVTGKFVFQNIITAVAPSATLISAGYLWDKYVALGGNTVPFRFNEYKGFDNIWGAAYLISKKDYPRFVRYGQPSVFLASNLLTIVKGLYQAECTCLDLGLTPAGFPFSVFKSSPLNVDAYLARLKAINVPEGYLDALQQLPRQNRKY